MDRRLRLLYLVPVLALAIGSTQLISTVRARQAERTGAYTRALDAEAEGRLIAALDDYARAGGHRDAVARRAAVLSRLAPYEDAYRDGLAALEAGEVDAAIAVLTPIVRDLPDFHDAATLLAEARTAHEAAVALQVDLAVAARDWLAAERALAQLAAADPSDPVIAARLRVIRHDHAPLAFARDQQLMVVGPDGADERVVTDDVPVAWPSWSPDRTRIAFVSVPSSAAVGEARLFVVDSDGANLTEVTRGVRLEGWPAWSPDGTKIAFTGEVAVPNDPGRTVRSVKIADLAAGQVTDVTVGLVANATSPTWSPAGDRLAFVSRRSNSPTISDSRDPSGAIYVLTLATGEIGGIAAGRFPDARRAAWSPAGDKMLIFSRGEGSPYDRESVTLVDLQTGDTEAIYESTHDVTSPVWSPDGRRFAFIAAGVTVHLRAVDGAAETVSLSGAIGRFLSWSPDGARLLVATSLGDSSSFVVTLADGPIRVEPMSLTYDTDRRLGGAPQWAPLAPTSTIATATLSGTARDNG